VRTRTAAGLLALTLLGLPLAAACAEGASVEVSRRDPDDTRSPRTDEPPETDPPETDPPETDPPETDPTTTRPPLSLPPPPTPAPSTPTPTATPDTVPPPTAPPSPDPTTDPNAPSGTLPPVDDLIELIPVSPPGDIDFDKSVDGCGVEGLCILTLVVDNTDYNAVAAYYEAEFPTLGVALDGVANDGQMWSATMNAPGVTGFAFVEASTDWPGYTDVLLSFFPA
jgi:hypothetical protein